MNRIDRLLSGFVFGLSVFAVAAIAAPNCYNVTYQACDPIGNCGVTGKSVKVCELSFVLSTPGLYKGEPNTEPRKCYTFSKTAQHDCNSPMDGYAKIPNCTLSTGGLCCYYKLSDPPAVSDGNGNIIRLNPIEMCIGTGTPSTPL